MLGAQASLDNCKSSGYGWSMDHRKWSRKREMRVRSWNTAESKGWLSVQNWLHLHFYSKINDQLATVLIWSHSEHQLWKNVKVSADGNEDHYARHSRSNAGTEAAQIKRELLREIHCGWQWEQSHCFMTLYLITVIFEYTQTHEKW